MSTHANALAKAAMFIADRESFSAVAYPDPLYGWQVPTIGYGTTAYPDGGAVKRGDKCTMTQARFWLLWHIERLLKPNMEAIPTWGLMNENQQAAILSIAYNLRNGAYFYGAKGRESLTTLVASPNKWRDADYVTAQFEKYRNPGSNVEKGLRRRRKAEAKLFMEAI